MFNFLKKQTKQTEKGSELKNQIINKLKSYTIDNVEFIRVISYDVYTSYEYHIDSFLFIKEKYVKIGDVEMGFFLPNPENIYNTLVLPLECEERKEIYDVAFKLIEEYNKNKETQRKKEEETKNEITKKLLQEYLSK